MTVYTRTATEPYTHTVAFRLTTSQRLELLPFFESCGGGSEAMRWLLSQPEVQKVMQARVDAERV
jgi:hypothetical protein